MLIRPLKKIAFPNNISYKPDQKSIDIHCIYDDVAELWARDEPVLRDDLISRPKIEELAQELGKNGVILDCACGDGNMCRVTSPFAKSVIGIDLSPNMLREAIKRSHKYTNINYIRGDILALGDILKPETIDMCLALFAVCCMKNQKELEDAFKQIHIVLKRGGFVIIQIPHPLDGLFQESSMWFRDIDKITNYFDSGKLIRRKIRTIYGQWLLVARYHFSLSNYFEAIASAGLIIKKVLEPKPSIDILRRYPDLKREAHLPSSLIFVAQRI